MLQTSKLLLHPAYRQIQPSHNSTHEAEYLKLSPTHSVIPFAVVTLLTFAVPVICLLTTPGMVLNPYTSGVRRQAPRLGSTRY
jgi:hypothetical protein